jgi:phage gp29-like protein
MRLVEKIKSLFKEETKDPQNSRLFGFVTPSIKTDQTTLMDRYESLLDDSQVTSTFQQRRLALTMTNTIIKPTNNDEKSADLVKKIIDKLEFDSIIDKMSYAIFFGYSIGELMFEVEDNMILLSDIKVRRPRRFAFDIDDYLYLRGVNNDSKVKLDKSKFWILKYGGFSNDEVYGRGLAQTLQYPVLLKRQALDAWHTFLQKYSIPPLIGYLPPGSDTDVYNKLLEIVTNFQSANGLVLPDNLRVEMLEPSRNGSPNFESFINICDQSISKIVLSQTMTTDNGSSQSQATVHQNVKDEIVKADSKIIANSFKKQVLDKIVYLNYPDGSAPIIEFESVDNESLLNRSIRDKNISEAFNVSLSIEDINRIYGGFWNVNNSI